MTGRETYDDARALWQSMGAVAREPWPTWESLDREERIKWECIALEHNDKIIEDAAHDYREIGDGS